MRLLLGAVLAVAVWLFLSRKGQAAIVAQPTTDFDTDNDFSSPSLDLVSPMDQTGVTLQSIVQAVIQRESSGRQTDASGNTLTSPTGALGLMQLEPATAAWLGVDPNNAQQNVAGGTKYLQLLFNQFGNWFDALAAYNWGPGNVQKAKASGSPYPSDVTAYANEVLENAS